MAFTFLKREAVGDSFICGLCWNKLYQPKLLPCLHRFCRDCLSDIDDCVNGESIKCPSCSYQSKVPQSGVDGFQDDRYTNSMLRLKDFREAVEGNDITACGCCPNPDTVSAYCSKCEFYLCDQCYKLHLQDDNYTDHIQHALTLMQAKQIPERLTRSETPPTCQSHPGQLAILCCLTCNGTYICVACSINRHSTHTKAAVTDLVNIERQRLTIKLSELTTCEVNMIGIPPRVDEVQRELSRNVLRKKEKLKKQYDEESTKLNNIMKEQEIQMKENVSELEMASKAECSAIRLETERKMQKLLDECEKLIKEEKKQFADKVHVLTVNHKLENQRVLNTMKSLEDNFRHQIKLIESIAIKNQTDLEHVVQFAGCAKDRSQTFCSTATKLLAFEDVWSDARYLPEIVQATQKLIDDMRKDFSYLETLADFDIEDLKRFGKSKTITSENTVVVNADGVKAKGLLINGVTGTKDGHMVLSGCATKDFSYISVMDGKGKLVRCDKFGRNVTCAMFPNRFCSFFKDSLVVTVCIPDEVGVYDVRDGSYRKRNIGKDIQTWTMGTYTYCVATEPLNKYIFVGTNSRYIYVLNDQLNYLRTIELPNGIRQCRDLEVTGKCLLVCDDGGRKACALSTEDSEDEVLFTISQPQSTKEEAMWTPLSVCTDGNHCIYIIWVRSIPGEVKRFLAQYNPEGEELQVIPIDGDARCVTTFQTEESEKLVVVTLNSGKLILIHRDCPDYEILL